MAGERLSCSCHLRQSRLDRGAPCDGEDNDYVYGELLGMSSQEIKALAEEGVIGITPCVMFMETRYTYLEHRPDTRT
jgi:hypothetical protein